MWEKYSGAHRSTKKGDQLKYSCLAFFPLNFSFDIFGLCLSLNNCINTNNMFCMFQIYFNLNILSPLNNFATPIGHGKTFGIKYSEAQKKEFIFINIYIFFIIFFK